MASPVENAAELPLKLLLIERATLFLTKLAPLVGVAGAYEFIGPVSDILRRGMGHLHVLVDIANADVGALESDIGEPFTATFLQAAVGINTDPADRDSKEALRRFSRVIGFAIALPYAATALTTLLKLWLGERAPESIAETLGKLPEEFGLSWALGSVLEALLERSIGIPLEEMVNLQYRPARLEWQQLRALVKAHALEEKDFVKYAQLAGFRDEDIKHLHELDRQLMPMGDLQQLWRYNLMSKADVEDYLKRVGFNDKDANRLVALYIDRSKGQVDTLYRSVARHETEIHNLTIGQYRQVLEHAKLPRDEVDDDVAALQLELDSGKVGLSISTIKARFLHGNMTRHDAHEALLKHGYDPKDIHEIIDTWKYPAAHKERQLSASQVLSYLASGVLHKNQAYNHLIALGYSVQDAQFLVEHPKAHPGTHQMTVSYATAIQAYIDGIYTHDDLSRWLSAHGASKHDLDTLLRTAQYKLEHSKGHPGSKLSLTQGELIKCFKYGIFDQHTVHDRLVQLGYTNEDATVLLEIENRGVFDNAPPLFATLQDAMHYLEGLGYKIHAPADPHIGAAEGMVAGAGYTYDLPPAPSPVPVTP